MGLVGGVGPANYNGFNFGQNVKSVVASRFEYDAADRTVVATVHSITLKTQVAVAVGSTTDATILDMRRRLSKPGQILTFSGNGLGGFTINVVSPLDVRWGPKPRSLKLMPIGNSQAIEVEWTVEVSIPDCSQAVYKGALMAFNYEVDFSVDNTGLTTRTISGYYEIPMTRIVGSKGVPDTADAYLEDIVPPIPTGFERKEKTRRISMDKRRCDFVFTDAELPNQFGFPPGIVDAEGEHSVQSFPNNLNRYTATVNASYIVAQGQPKGVAYDAFYALLLDRSSVSDKDKSRIFINFSAREGLYRNRRIAFSAAWTYTSNFVNAVADGGMFRLTPDTNWLAWIDSNGVRQAAAPRGFAGLVMKASDDSIVDLCNPKAVSVLRSRGSGTSTLRSRGATASTIQGLDPDQSWVSASIRLVVDTNQNRIRLKPLPDAPLPTGGDIGEVSALQGGAPIAQNGNFNLNALNNQQPAIAKKKAAGKLANQIAIPASQVDVIQQRCTPSYRVWLVGDVVRAGYHVTIPKLTTVAGLTPAPDQQWAEEESVANWSGIPIYAARFSLGYLLNDAPDGVSVTVPGNPAIEVVG